MIRTKKRSILKKVLAIFMPIVSVGCIVALFWSESIITIICGDEYAIAANLFRYLVPLLFVSFPSQLYGWPALGAIGKANEITKSTVMAALVQILGLVILVIINRFEFVWLSFVRLISELTMLIVRYKYYRKYKTMYALEKG